MYIGAAANPFAGPNVAMRVSRLAKKVAAGVQFVQTQCIYNMNTFKEFMKLMVDRGLHEKVAVLAGITPMKNVGMAKYMQKRVPGIDVPDDIVRRIGGVPKEKQAEEGITLAVEQIQELKEVEGVQRVSHHGHRVGRKKSGKSSNVAASFPDPSWPKAGKSHKDSPNQIEAS
jgi:methylenetetrahydrofolate reductase (NADPH)